MFEKEMLAINTTMHWNLGDDLIREGCFRLLGIGNNKKVYLNRSMLKGRNKVYKEQMNMPSVVDIVKNCDFLINAGTPGWYLEDIYSACLINKTPMIIIGAGTVSNLNGNYDTFNSCVKSNLIKKITTRDNLALNCFKRVGAEAKLFLDPAFFAKYEKVLTNKYDIVLNIRAGWGNGKSIDKNQLEIYKNIYNKFRERISIITVHEMNEYILAKEEFKGVEIFFSSDHEDYKNIYLNCNHYIGGRIHGSIPAFCGGADCHLLYDDSKKDVIVCANKIISENNLDGINLYPINSFNKIRLIESKQYLKRISLLKDEFEKYVDYLMM